MNIIIQNKTKRLKFKKIVSVLLCCLLSVGGMANVRANNSTEIAILQQVNEKKVTINKTNRPIREILVEIQKQSKINFAIDNDVIKSIGNVTLVVKDVTVKEVLAIILKNTDYTFDISSNYITIVKKTINSKKDSNDKSLVINGMVIDENKQPVVGATVLVANTANGAITDDNGNFTLTASEGQRLEVAFVGMKTLYYDVTKSESKLILKMNTDAMQVDDVVVTGYGAIKRSSFTGNSVVVKRDDLLKVSKTNVIKALQTFDPSFRIKENNQWGSDPNALPEVYIRGESGIGVKELNKNELSKTNLKDNPNLPIFIMDGFQISVTKLYDMDPNRIESVTILKDAAATALYGSRAANGVVVITTVVPKPGKLNISYNVVGDIVFPDLSDYNLMNAAEKLEIEKMAGAYTPDSKVGSAYNYPKEYNMKLANVLKGVDTYWLSKPLNAVFNHKHSVNVDGGSENLRFGIDLQYSNQDGIMRGSARDRFGAGFYLQYNLKNIQISNQTSYQVAQSKESKYGDFSTYTKALPYDEFMDAEGNYLRELKRWSLSSFEDLTNPLYEAGLNNFEKSQSEQLINNLSVNWNITKHLILKGQLSLTKSMDESEKFYDPRSLKNDDKMSSTNISSGTLYETSGRGLSIDMNAYLSYNRDVENHNINFQAGINTLENSSTSKSTTYKGFPSGELSSSNYAQMVDGKPLKSEGTNRLVGILAALNYSFKNIYLLDASFRLDGSSEFGDDKRFAPFWSGGVGLNIHNYKFMKDVSAINQLKVRASYGETGKVNFPSYAALTSYEIITDEWYRTGYGASIMALGNNTLRWETTNTFDTGFELGLLGGRIYAKASYYHKLTKDLINDVTIPSSTGFVTFRNNMGEVLNEGFEADVRVTAIRNKNMNLIVNGNLAHNKNTIKKISESLKEYNQRVQDKFASGNRFDDNFMSQPFLQYVEGGSLSSIWGVQSLGINPSTGEEVYLRPDGLQTDKWITSDQQVLGNKEASIQGSIGINFSYKQFSIYTSFMYECGGQRYNQTMADKIEGVNIYASNVDKRVMQDRWSHEGQVAKYKKMETGRSSVAKTRPTSRFVQDYNMLSWNSISLGYDFGEAVKKPLGLSMLRLEFGANDILHLSSVKQERGLSYPFARTFNFSLKTAF